MTVKFFETFIEISRLQSELNRSLRNLLQAQKEEARRLPGEIIPELDIFETQDYIILKADLPGVKREDIKLTLSGRNLLISGIKRRMEISSNKTKFHCLERSYGGFKRIINLDVPINTDDVKAWLKNGLLTIVFNKLQEKSPQEIPIEIKQS